VTAFDGPKAVIGSSPLFSEMDQFGQIRLSNSDMVAAHIAGYGRV
jgi:hypothetical protein